MYSTELKRNTSSSFWTEFNIGLTCFLWMRDGFILTSFSRYSKTVRFPKTVSILVLSGILSLRERDWTERERERDRLANPCTEFKNNRWQCHDRFTLMHAFALYWQQRNIRAAASCWQHAAPLQRNTLVHMYFCSAQAQQSLYLTQGEDGRWKKKKRKKKKGKPNALLKMMCSNYLCIQGSKEEHEVAYLTRASVGIQEQLA